MAGKLTHTISFPFLRTWIPDCQGKKRLVLNRLLTLCLSLTFKPADSFIKYIKQRARFWLKPRCLCITLAIERSLKRWCAWNVFLWPLSGARVVQRTLEAGENLSQTQIYVVLEGSAGMLCWSTVLQLSWHQVRRAEECWKLKYRRAKSLTQ